jgi:carboxyl-terminal processing protease
MKYIFLVITIIFFQITYSQTKVTEVNKIESLINIWGLLKYQHPDVSKGKFDVNEEFINEFNRLASISNQEQLNAELVDWIKKFDSENTKYKSNPDFLKTKKLFTKNSDFNWIENSNFNQELIDLINKVKNNSNFYNYYASINSLSGMVEFKNEKGYSNFDSNIISNRILFLASFWNTMRYWNVNIYLTDMQWSKVLTEAISEFIDNDEIKFELAKHKLISKLNDSHSDYSSINTSSNTFTKFPVFKGKIVNDSLVITQLFNTDLAKKDNVNLGDVIYSVEGKSLKNYYLNKFTNLISASNENFLKYRTANFHILLSKNTDSIQIGLRKKDGTLYDKFIGLYKSSEYEIVPTNLASSIKGNSQQLSNTIGYLNLSVINKVELKNAFKSFENTKGIVIDLRNYPSNISAQDIAYYLYPTKKVFIKTLTSLSPGFGEYDSKAALSIIKNPFSAGSDNANYYKGKIILLVNRSTQSKAEWIGMAIQQAPNCITIGEQTSGAIMNVNRITLVDKSTADFTGVGAFYPNDAGVQRKGLKIDYQVNESAINYNPNLYIEKAIDLIQQ